MVKTRSDERKEKRFKDYIQSENVYDRMQRRVQERSMEISAQQAREDREIARTVKQYRFETQDAVFSPGLKASLHGKSRNGICDTLLLESRRNIACDNDETELKKIENMLHQKSRRPPLPDDDFSPQLKARIRGATSNVIRDAILAECQSKIESKLLDAHQKESMDRTRRAVSECRVINYSIVDDVRATKHLDFVSNSLNEVKHKLKTFTDKTTNLYELSSKQTSIEIEQLNARVVEAETKLKTEIIRIKKKMQIHITELEMALDVANRTNIDLQKTIKKQSLQLTDLQAAYEDVTRNLQQTMDQYSVAQRRIQSLTGELEEVRVNLDSTTRSKRGVEMQLEEVSTRCNELTSFNVSINAARAKLETEIQQIASDYEEVTRELRVSDERYQKVQV